MSILILVLMEDALRELILRRAEFQPVTVLFSENPLDFRGKSVPNCPQIYEFPRLCPTLSEHLTGLTHYNSISKISSGVIRASFFLRRSVDVPLSLSLSR